MKGPFVFAALTVSTSLVWTGLAAAESATSCVAAFDQGQELESSLKLQEARELFLSCAREACHPMVRKDCAAHLEDVARDMPSASLGARDRTGTDLTDVRVFVDGKSVTMPKAGAALPLDPGEHSIRFERKGYEPHVERIVLRVGEKNRAVIVTLEREASEGAREGARDVDLSAPKPSEARAEGSSRTPIVLALGGVSLVGLGGFALFGLTGLSERNHLIETCAPGCSERAASVVRDRYLAADILLGVGIVAGAAAAFVHLSSPRSQARATARR